MQRVPYWRLSAYYFAYFSFFGVFFPYYTLYLQSLSFSAWDIGLVMSQMQLMRMFGPYFWGGLADRVGHRLRIVRATGTVALLVFSAFLFARHLGGLLAAIAVFAFFLAASLPLVEALTFDHLRENAAHYSRIRLWGSAGYIFGVMGGGALFDYLPLAAVLWLSLATLAVSIGCSLCLPESRSHQLDEPPAPIGEILRQPRIRALLAASFATASSNAVLNVFYSIFLTEHGYSKAMVGTLSSLSVVAEIVAFLFMARVMRRYSLRTILMTSFAVAVVRFLMIGWGGDSLTVLVLTQAMHAVTFGAFHSAAIGAISRWFPASARSRGQALYAAISVGAGGWFGGVVSGWTWDHLGSAATFALAALYSLAGLLLVALWIRERPVGEMRASRVVSGEPRV